jgi:hypothetical protein
VPSGASCQCKTSGRQSSKPADQAITRSKKDHSAGACAPCRTNRRTDLPTLASRPVPMAGETCSLVPRASDGASDADGSISALADGETARYRLGKGSRLGSASAGAVATADGRRGTARDWQADAMAYLVPSTAAERSSASLGLAITFGSRLPAGGDSQGNESARCFSL